MIFGKKPSEDTDYSDFFDRYFISDFADQMAQFKDK